METWTHSGLLLSQTCGMPYRKFLHDKVNLVGTPDYDLDNCPPGHYRSAIVIRQNDRRGSLAEFANSRFAYNEENSQSGFAAPLNHGAEMGIVFSNRIRTHSHVNSAKIVAEDQADIAALDQLSWQYMERYDDFANSLTVLEWTKPATPTLPFITAESNDADIIYSAIESAIAALSADDRSAMCLKGIMKIPKDAYLAVANPS